jgi:hypothetical protein
MLFLLLIIRKKKENVVKYGPNLNYLLIILFTYTKRRTIEKKEEVENQLKKLLNITIH